MMLPSTAHSAAASLLMLPWLLRNAACVLEPMTFPRRSLHEHPLRLYVNTAAGCLNLYNVSLSV